MIPFNLVRAESLEEVLDFLDRNGPGTKIIAGGTDLLIELRGISPGEKGPGTVLDITPIDELKGIEDDGTVITIGALATHREINTSPIILEHAPLLAAACSTIGATQHRNVATIGGNVINGSPAADSVPALLAHNAAATTVAEFDQACTEISAAVPRLDASAASARVRCSCTNAMASM